jgi:dolichol-phosphate mannosyltransferase
MISVVIPTLNEASNIRSLIPAIIDVFFGRDLEIVVVDGCSTDGTQDVVRDFGVKYGCVRLLLQSGRGFANALSEGLNAVAGDVIVTMDAENHLPSEIPKLVDCLSSGAFDVVIGSRFVKGADVKLDRKRLLSSRLANEIAKTAFKLDVNDCSSGFRAYRAPAVKQAIKNLRTKYFSVQVEILEKIKKNGGRLGEIPVHYVKRECGKSKFRFNAAIRDATKLLEIARENEIEELKEKSRGFMTKVGLKPGKRGGAGAVQ